MIFTGRASLFPKERLPLQGLRICISGGVPERKYWGGVLDLDRQILSFVAKLSALIMDYGGTVVHGSHPSFTPVLLERARERGNKRLTLVASRLFGSTLRAGDEALPAVVAGVNSHANVILAPKSGVGDASDPETRNSSLTVLRHVLLRESDVLVAVGGKLHRDMGFNPGFFEEMAIARWNNVPCFVVAGLGAKALAEERKILDAFSQKNGLTCAQRLAIAKMNDGFEGVAGDLLVHIAHARDKIWRASAGPDARTIRPIESIIKKQFIQCSEKRLKELRTAIERLNMVAVHKLLRPPNWCVEPAIASSVVPLGKGKKRVKKNTDGLGIVYIQSTLGDTRVTITDVSGNVIGWSSAGMRGFKGSRKSTPFAARAAAGDVAAKAMERGLKRVLVHVSGLGANREPALRALSAAGLKISQIRDAAPHRSPAKSWVMRKKREWTSS